jgi:hypothetical protein
LIPIQPYFEEHRFFLGPLLCTQGPGVVFLGRPCFSVLGIFMLVIVLMQAEVFTLCCALIARKPFRFETNNFSKKERKFNK